MRMHLLSTKNYKKGGNDMHKYGKSILAKSLAFALVLSVGIAAPDVQAAKKPKLSKKKVTLTVKKSKKIKIKNVKAKKVKKLTVTSSKKSIVKVKKNGKTAFTVTARKAGKSTVTAKIKIGKKTTKLKLTVTVKKVKPTKEPTVTPAPSPTPPHNKVETPTSVPTPTQKPTKLTSPLIRYTEDFETGLWDWFARGNEGVQLEISEEAHEGKGAALCYGREGADGLGHSWNGPAIDLSDYITAGGKYKATLWAKIPAEDANTYKRGIKLMVSAAKYYTKESMDKGEEPSCENFPRDTTYDVNATDWTKIEFEFSVPDYFYNYIFYVETSGFGKARFLIDDVTLERISAPAEFDPALTSIKDTYAPHIDTMGVAAEYAQIMNQNTLGFIKHHFNSITAGNEMKLDAMMGSQKTIKLSEASSDYVVSDAYKSCADNKDADGDVIVPEIDFSGLDAYLKAAKENGLRARIHSPFWHQQNPGLFFTKQYEVIDNKKDTTTQKDTADPEKYTDAQTMYTREDMYVRTLLNHICTSQYGDVVYAYDVVNEYLNMKNEGSYTNHWKYIFGSNVETDSQYVKQAFASAYAELEKQKRTDISLIYNDYNTYDQPEEVISLIQNINKKDDLNPEGKKICAGIGMQSHINMKDDGAVKYEAALKAFAAADFEIQITELDVTCTGVVKETTAAATKEKVWTANAEQYSSLMKAILRQKAAGTKITSVTLWGLTDASSWRPDNAPLLFGANLADKKPAFDSFINATKDFVNK